MNSMYHENYYSYLPPAVALDKEVSTVVLPIFEKYMADGYSPREISQIMQVSVEMVECEVILEIGGKFTKEKKNNTP